MDLDAVNTTYAIAFTIGGLVVAAVLTALALGPLRERGGRGRGHAAAHDHEEGGVPAPFAPTPGDRSPLGATDQTSDAQTSRATRSAHPSEPRGG